DLLRRARRAAVAAAAATVALERSDRGDRRDGGLCGAAPALERADPDGAVSNRPRGVVAGPSAARGEWRARRVAVGSGRGPAALAAPARRDDRLALRRPARAAPIPGRAVRRDRSAVLRR